MASRRMASKRRRSRQPRPSFKRRKTNDSVPKDAPRAAATLRDVILGSDLELLNDGRHTRISDNGERLPALKLQRRCFNQVSSYKRMPDTSAYALPFPLKRRPSIRLQFASRYLDLGSLGSQRPDGFVSIHKAEGDMLTSGLQELLYKLNHYPYPESYKEEANLTGAKVMERKRVYQLNSSQPTDVHEGGSLRHQLVKQYLGEDFYLDRLKDLQRLCGDQVSGAVWMSDTLPYDLALPMEGRPPNSLCFQVGLTLYNVQNNDDMNTSEMFQAVLLAPRKPAILFTVLEDCQGKVESKAEKKGRSKAEVFTLQMGKLLTSAIFNFCCCDFRLVPVTIRREDFGDAGKLKDEVGRRVRETQINFGNPRVLTPAVYRELKDAVTAVVGTSCIPYLGTDTSLYFEESLVLMDQDWRAVVSLLIEELTSPKDELHKQMLYFPKQGSLKMEVAVLEVSKRLGCREEVIIVTEMKDLTQRCKHLKTRMLDYTGVELKLNVDRSSLDVDKSSVDIDNASL